MDEIWKPIIGYEGIYEISSTGRVKRITSAQGSRIGKFLKATIMHDGYLRVTLYNGNNARNSYLVHRLVAETFIGPQPPNHEINHRDGNKENNHPDNLEWVTRSENMRHSIDILNVDRTRRGEDSNMAKLTERQIREIRQIYNDGDYSPLKLSHKYAVNRSTIWDIVTKRTWKHI